MDLARSLLLLGSNLGEKELNLSSTIQYIVEGNTCKILSSSSVYETEPWGIQSKNNYLNQAIVIETSLNPFNLLTFLQETEAKFGRTRSIKWEDRIIDIDILLYNDFVLDSLELKIPHPELPNRRFALIPAVEIASEWKHPLYHQDLKSLLDVCQDFTKVWLKP
ncbi:MAG: 2-amino-4-hydroxy-6-hydroxymethyldihydropteridine diphosphokinase [Opitutaceae bacterium]|nr:2-amino-4-hydroxy-6-hydroxymethyldihydropteridine diphosphokinase [Cytophagales bacterium]